MLNILITVCGLFLIFSVPEVVALNVASVRYERKLLPFGDSLRIPAFWLLPFFVGVANFIKWHTAANVMFTLELILLDGFTVKKAVWNFHANQTSRRPD